MDEPGRDLPPARARGRSGLAGAGDRMRAAAAWLGRRWWAVGVVVVMLYAFPHYPRIRSANELPRVYLVMAMADDHTFAIDRGVARWGSTADVSPYGGHSYSNKAPGSSMLAVPAYLALRGVTHALAGREPTLGEMVWTFRVWTGVVPTLLFGWLLWGFLARFAPEREARRAVLTAYLLGSMALTYSILFISHQLSAVCVGTAWIVTVWVAEDGRRARWMIVAGLAAGAAPLVDYQAVFAAVPVAVWATWRLIATRRGAAPFLLAAAGAAVPIVALLAYHDACFDSPWRTGYAASKTFAHFHQVGFLGLDRPHWAAFTGSTISPDNGLVLLCPALLLALPGWVLMWRRDQRDHAAVTAAVAAVFMLFISSITFWRGGWQMGPRYITAMLPFLLPAMAVALAAVERRPAWRGAALGMIGVGVFVYAGAAVEFPHFPEKFKNPIYEVTVRLIGDGLAAPNLGQAIGVPGAWSLIPFAALVAALWGRAVLGAGPLAGDDRREWRRRRAIGAAVAVAVSTVTLLAYRGFAGGGPVADAAYRATVAPSVRERMLTPRPGDPRR